MYIYIYMCVCVYIYIYSQNPGCMDLILKECKNDSINQF